MALPTALSNLIDVQEFQFQQVINEDPLTHSLILLGTLPNPGKDEDDRMQAIVRLEKTALSPSDGPRFFGEYGLINHLKLEESTDIYTWFFGWLGDDRGGDVKVNLIYPATEVHIRKYTRQQQVMVQETPEIYETVVKPYIASFPPARTQWVEDILDGHSEQSKVLFSNTDFMILPDMKWDLTTVTSLYLVALVQDRSIRSLRDLKRTHIDLLKAIRQQSHQIVTEKWNLGPGSLRLYIHYQPSYYHFHVHIVNANYQGTLGMAVGQAHLLDDVISMLELDPAEGPGIFQRMTLTYGLGDQHGLLEKIQSSMASFP